MRYHALAADYDGTLAHDGSVDEPTLAALRRLRESGRKLIMVTGRELPDLKRIFEHFELFDRVVGENGAVLFNPATSSERLLAAAPPPALLDEMVRRKIPVSVGRTVVATFEPHEHGVLSAIRELGLEWHVIFNKHAVMALPANITKATGLAAALEDLSLDASNVIGVGDAENDHAFLRRCGLSVAVANALDSLKANVDWVTDSARGAGVTELIDRLLADELADIEPDPELRDPIVDV